MRTPLSRRTLLRAGAASVALPLLDAMLPRCARAAAEAMPPKRMVLLHRGLGTYHPHLVPTTSGKDYTPTRYLKHLERHRRDFTLLSGVSHLGYPNSHVTSGAIFTGVDPKGLGSGNFNIRNSISLDQMVAEQIGGATRVRSLTLNSMGGAPSLSWNEKGVPLPANGSRSRLFQQLFINGSPEEIDRQMERLAHGHSILDNMIGQLHVLHRDLSAADRERMQVMETSIREAEVLLHQDEAWTKKPKPVVEAVAKDFGDQTDTWLQSQQRWFALIRLALQTDSTRVIVYGLGEQNNTNIPDLEIGHHDASHHGKDPEKIEQFARYEEKEYQNFSGFLDLLASTDEAGSRLLDNTQVLLTSNLGDASAHASNNLPTFLAGGGFQHQGHIAFDPNNNYPLSNLYVRMLQQIGVETERFGGSTGALSELG